MKRIMRPLNHRVLFWADPLFEEADPRPGEGYCIYSVLYLSLRPCHRWLLYVVSHRRSDLSDSAAQSPNPEIKYIPNRVQISLSYFIGFPTYCLINRLQQKIWWWWEHIFEKNWISEVLERSTSKIANAESDVYANRIGTALKGVCQKNLQYIIKKW